VTHVNGVGDEATIVKVDLDVLGVGRRIELDGELGAISLEGLGGDLDSGGTGRVALEVGRSVDLVAELGNVGVLGGGLENGLLNRVGSRDQESTIEKEKSDTVIQTSDGRLRTSSEALALGLGRVVQKNLKSGVLSNTETLSTLLGTVDPSDGTISKKSTLDHTATLRHGVQLPGGVGIERLHATAGGVSRSSDVLVRATTTDDDIRVPLVGAREGHHDGATGVGVCTVGSGKVRKSTNDIASTNVEDLSGLGDLDEEVTILHQVKEGVHVVGLVLAEDLHVDGFALRGTVGVEDLVGRVVVLRLSRVKTVQGAGSDEDLVVGHDLNGSVPTSSVELCARLVPSLTIERSIGSRALEETNTLEAVTDGGINEVERSVTAERHEATISQEDTARAKGVGLVGQGSKLLGGGVVLRRVGILAVGKLKLGVVLNLVEEDDLAVRHETGVHSRDTRATLDLDGTGLGSSRSRAGLRSGNGGRIDARTRLAALAAVGSCVTAVSVHRAARSLSPAAADHVIESGTAASIGGLLASCDRVVGGLSKDGFTTSGSRRRTGDSSSGGSSSGGGTLAAVLAAVGNEAVAISRTAVAVRAAASAVSTVGVAASAAKVLTAATIIASGNRGVLGSYRSSGRCGGRVAATGQASSSAMTLGRSTPSVLRAASALVDCAVGVAEQVAVVGSALSILRVLALPLLWHNAKV